MLLTKARIDYKMTQLLTLNCKTFKKRSRSSIRFNKKRLHLNKMDIDK